MSFGRKTLNDSTVGFFLWFIREKRIYPRCLRQQIYLTLCLVSTPKQKVFVKSFDQITSSFLLYEYFDVLRFSFFLGVSLWMRGKWILVYVCMYLFYPSPSPVSIGFIFLPISNFSYCLLRTFVFVFTIDVSTPLSSHVLKSIYTSTVDGSTLWNGRKYGNRKRGQGKTV